MSLNDHDRAVFEQLDAQLQESGLGVEVWRPFDPDQPSGEADRGFREGGHRILPPTEHGERWQVVRSDRHGDYHVVWVNSAAEAADVIYEVLVGRSRPAG